MRKITDHIVDGDSANHQLDIEAIDEPGSGGAHHFYNITGFDALRNPAVPNYAGMPLGQILFQNGPIKEAGVNGLTHEALLVIVIDRLRSFQAGPFASTMNEQALRHIEQGLDHLQQRTRERIKRGVEGTHKT